jgi:hypothetical protein
VSNLWIPGLAAGPLEDWVARLHRHIEAYAQDAGVEKAFVEIELADGSRYCLDRISPEPGFGFVTLRPHCRPDEDDDVPDELVVPVGAIRRIELNRAEEQRAQFGFRLPEP